MKKKPGKKFLLVQNLGLHNLFIIFFLRLFHDRIFYLKISEGVKTSVFFRILDFFDINGLDYSRVRQSSLTFFRGIVPDAILSFYKERLAPSALEKKIRKGFGLDKNQTKKLQVAMLSQLTWDHNDFFQLYFFALALEKSPGARVFLLCPPCPLHSHLASTGEKFFPVVNIPGLDLLDLLSTLWEKAGRMVKKLHAAPGQLGGHEATMTEPLPGRAAPGDFEVLFFPHLGIFYCDLFAKDYFYSPREASPLYHRKILHVSLGENPDKLTRSYQYYQERGIPFLDLFAGETWRDQAGYFGATLIFLLKNLKATLADLRAAGSASTWYYLLAHLKLSRFLARIAPFKRAKLAITGYDILFPHFLSLALSLRGIKTVAVQDRFFSTFRREHCLNIDYYFVIGEVVARELRSHPEFFAFRKIFVNGLVRCDWIKDQAPVQGDKYFARKKSFLLLALDMHPGGSTPEEARLTLCDWTCLKKFYCDLVRLSFDFPGIHIVIKGKNNAVQAIPEFQDLVRLIESLPNIEFEKELATYSPYLLASYADGAVAIPTSLADEMLAVGKPVVLYRLPCGAPEAYFDYAGLPLTVSDYPELREKVRLMVEGQSLWTEADSEKFKDLYFNYSKPDYSPQAAVLAFLEKILFQDRRSS